MPIDGSGMSPSRGRGRAPVSVPDAGDTRSVTVWMNMPAFYQEDLFRAVLATGQVALDVIYARDIAPERRQLGWQRGRCDYPHRFLPARSGVLRAAWLAATGRSALHIVNGIWAEPAFLAALVVLALRRAPFALYSEAPAPNGGRRATRLAKWLVGGWVVSRAAGLLAVSHFASRYYQRLGLAPDRCYPFGYFRAAAEVPPSVDAKGDGSLDLVYAGQLVPRKGLDLLLEAMRALAPRYPTAKLALIGSGPQQLELARRIEREGLDGRVVFEEVLPADRIRERLARADLLLLPSHWDGWGMVVNDALSVGTPVIVSDRCGAAEVVRHGENGYVFRAGDLTDLTSCLDRALASPDRLRAMRLAARLTGESLAADAVAPYLVECLRHMAGRSSDRPTPPWLAWSSESGARP